MINLCMRHAGSCGSMKLSSGLVFSWVMMFVEGRISKPNTAHCALMLWQCKAYSQFKEYWSQKPQTGCNSLGDPLKLFGSIQRCKGSRLTGLKSSRFSWIVFLWSGKSGPQSCNLSPHRQCVWVVCLTFSFAPVPTFKSLSKKCIVTFW